MGLTYQPLSHDTRWRLSAAGLDPDVVAGIVRRAVDEELMGGVDVTSVATVPADQRSAAMLASRAEGIVAGLAVAGAVIDVVCGGSASSIEPPGRRRVQRPPRR